jgi:hypothetical protein
MVLRHFTLKIVSKQRNWPEVIQTGERIIFLIEILGNPEHYYN